jgi:hypothetical protein
MVMKLKQFPNMKFIWAEISYLARWWADQNIQVFTLHIPCGHFVKEGLGKFPANGCRKQWI